MFEVTGQSIFTTHCWRCRTDGGRGFGLSAHPAVPTWQLALVDDFRKVALLSKDPTLPFRLIFGRFFCDCVFRRTVSSGWSGGRVEGSFRVVLPLLFSSVKYCLASSFFRWCCFFPLFCWFLLLLLVVVLSTLHVRGLFFFDLLGTIPTQRREEEGSTTKRRRRLSSSTRKGGEGTQHH